MDRRADKYSHTDVSKGYRCAVIKDYIDKSEQGECIYEDGIIRKDAAIHCSEGRKKLKIE